MTAGEFGEPSGELCLSSAGESLCLATSLPSEPPCPPGVATSSSSVVVGGAGGCCWVGLAGLERQWDVAGPVLSLPTAKEEEEAEEEVEEGGEEGEEEVRVGLWCWLPRKSWYGTVARMGCGTPLGLTTRGGLVVDADADIANYSPHIETLRLRLSAWGCVEVTASLFVCFQSTSNKKSFIKVGFLSSRHRYMLATSASPPLFLLS